MNKNCGRMDCMVFVETDIHSAWYGKTFQFDFSDIRSETLRGQIAYYIWKNYRAGDKTLATLRQEKSWLRYYEAWLWERGIDALEEIGEADVEGFLTFLHLSISEKTGHTLRLITQKHIYDTVRGLYRWYAWQSPVYAEAAAFFPRDVYQRINRTARAEHISGEKRARFLHALERADNPCLRYGGTILATTGITPADLLGLETDCVRIMQGGTCLRYYHHRKRVYRTMPVNKSCIEAVESLKVQTEDLRRIAPEETKQRLFLHYSKRAQVIVPDADLFRYWLRRLDGCGAEEKESFTPAQIRSACVRDMLRFLPPVIVGEVTGASSAVEAADISQRSDTSEEAAKGRKSFAERRCGV